MDFHERKQYRTDYFHKFVYGWKLKPCIACNGSGRYDNTGSPKCSSCDGTGKYKCKPEKSHENKTT